MPNDKPILASEGADCEAYALQHFFEQSIDLLATASTRDGTWKRVNPAFRRLLGWLPEDLVGQPFSAVIHPDDRPRSEAATRDLAAGKPLIEFEHRVLCRDGSYKWIAWHTAPNEAEGLMYCIGRDVTEARQLQERQKVLFAELQHRTRNLIGVIRRMADRTAGDAASLEDFLPVFRDRLDTLARVNGLLSGLDHGERIAFDQLLQAELEARGLLGRTWRGRLALDGPAGVRLRSATVQIFALAIHELITNAVKYGALSAPGGRLGVTWRISRSEGEGERLQVDWAETGVANMPEPGAAPRGGGYGRMLIEEALPYQLRARVTYRLGPDGVRCTIDLPLT